MSTKIPTHEAVMSIKLTREQESAIKAAAAKLVERPGVWARNVLVVAAE